MTAKIVRHVQLVDASDHENLDDIAGVTRVSGNRMLNRTETGKWLGKKYGSGRGKAKGTDLNAEFEEILKNPPE